MPSINKTTKSSKPILHSPRLLDQLSESTQYKHNSLQLADQHIKFRSLPQADTQNHSPCNGAICAYTPATLPLYHPITSMKPNLDTALHLLHSASFGALATQSLQMPEYPFATALPFVPDEQHRPVFLVSQLAEHTKNLLANHRACLLVTAADQSDVLAGPRMSIIGDVARIDASPELIARCVRYQPEAEQYLALGDFTFFALTPKKSRYIGGFAQMGWIEPTDWAEARILSLADEAIVIDKVESALPAGIRLLGADCYGCDIERNEKRERVKFPDSSGTAEEIAASIRQLLAASS
jgi:heme iron utilization protein